LQIDGIVALAKAAQGKLDPNLKNRDGLTPLLMALRGRSAGLAAAIVRNCKNIDMDAKDPRGATALDSMANSILSV
jgi:ankyrin repeat protein